MQNGSLPFDESDCKFHVSLTAPIFNCVKSREYFYSLVDEYN